MAALPPNFNTQFFTNEGVPAAGYLLHTYDTGTTTPKATFTTQAGTCRTRTPSCLIRMAGARSGWALASTPCVWKPPPLRW
jgi:hypothetical protein